MFILLIYLNYKLPPLKLSLKMTIGRIRYLAPNCLVVVNALLIIDLYFLPEIKDGVNRLTRKSLDTSMLCKVSKNTNIQFFQAIAATHL